MKKIDKNILLCLEIIIIIIIIFQIQLNILSKVSIYIILIYPIIAYLYNILSFSLLNLSFRKLIIFKNINNYLLFYLTNSKLLRKYCLVALVEEIIWRVTPYYVVQKYNFSYPYLILIIITLIFSISHFVNKNIINLWSFFEFTLFFLGLMFIYIITNDLILIYITHIIRNMNYYFISNQKCKY